MWRILIALLAASALVIGFGQVYRHHRAHSQRAALVTPKNSDYYMNDAVVYQFDKTGSLAYRMTVAQSLHYPNDSATLSDIALHYLAGSKTYWNLHSSKGRVPAGRKDIYLYDGVTAQHPQPNGNMVHLVTDNAWVHPKTNIVNTRAHAKATQPGQTVEGDGVRVNLNTDRLQILDNVKVQYSQ